MAEFIHTVSGSVLTLILVLNTRRFAIYCFMDNEPVMNNLLRGQFWLTSALLMRAVYWSVIMPLMVANCPDVWKQWSQLIQGDDYINTGFNLLAAFGAWMILRGGYYMIPEEERREWNVLSSAFYPYSRCVMVRIHRLLWPPK